MTMVEQEAEIELGLPGVTVSAHVDPALAATLARLAKRSDRSLSREIGRALRLYAENEAAGPGPPEHVARGVPPRRAGERR